MQTIGSTYEILVVCWYDTWVQFPVRISTVYSKLLPINDLVFNFLTKYLYMYLLL